jgi:hypothetical protein
MPTNAGPRSRGLDRERRIRMAVRGCGVISEGEHGHAAKPCPSPPPGGASWKHSLRVAPAAHGPGGGRKLPDSGDGPVMTNSAASISNAARHRKESRARRDELSVDVRSIASSQRVIEPRASVHARTGRGVVSESEELSAGELPDPDARGPPAANANSNGRSCLL